MCEPQGSAGRLVALDCVQIRLGVFVYPPYMVEQPEVTDMKTHYAIAMNNIILDRSGALSYQEAQVWRDAKLRQGSRMVALLDTQGRIGDRVLIDEDGVAIVATGQIGSKIDRGVYRNTDQLRVDLRRMSRLSPIQTTSLFRWIDLNIHKDCSLVYQYRVFLALHQASLRRRP